MAMKLYPSFAAEIRRQTPWWLRWVPLRWRRIISVELTMPDTTKARADDDSVDLIRDGSRVGRKEK